MHVSPTAMVEAWSVAVALVLSGSLSALAAERYEDAVGDALGDAPDVVAVTIDELEGPVLRFSVELDREPPLRADETGGDILWLALDTRPEVTFPELDGYSFSTLGLTLAGDLETGGHLLVGTEAWWHVVDIAFDGATISFSLDRKLLGDPDELYFRVYGAIFRETLYTEEADHFPEVDQPPAHYLLAPGQD